MEPQKDAPLGQENYEFKIDNTLAYPIIALMFTKSKFSTIGSNQTNHFTFNLRQCW